MVTIMDEKELEKLYGVVSEKFDIGTFDAFKEKMTTSEDRKKFYDVVDKKGFSLGDYDAYEKRLGKSNEVSLQGSETTSETSTEPLPASQTFDEFGMPVEYLTDESLILPPPADTKNPDADILEVPVVPNDLQIAGTEGQIRQEKVPYGEWLSQFNQPTFLSKGWFDLEGIYKQEEEVGNYKLTAKQKLAFTTPSNPLFSTKSAYYGGSGKDEKVAKWISTQDEAGHALKLGTYNKETNGMKAIIDTFQELYSKYTLLDTDGSVIYANGEISPKYEKYALYGESGEIDAPTSLKNTLSNIGNRLSGFDDRLAIMSADTWEAILGKELTGNINEFFDAQSFSDKRTEAYAELDKLQTEVKTTRDLGEALRSKDAIGSAVAILDLMGSVVPSAPLAVAGGVPLVLDFAGDYVYQYNKEKARQMGVSVEKLYKDGNNDYVAPAMLGTVAGLLEKFQIKNAKQILLSSFDTKGSKVMVKLLGSVNKEGLQEWFQYGTEQGNLKAADPKATSGEVGGAITEALFSEQGIKAYLYAAVASMGIGGVGKLAKTFGTTSRSLVNNYKTFYALMTDAGKFTKGSPERLALEVQMDEVAGKMTNDLAKAAREESKLEALPLEDKVKVNKMQQELADVTVAIENPETSNETKGVLAQKEAELEIEMEDLIDSAPEQTVKEDVSPEATIPANIVEAFKGGEEGIRARKEQVYKELVTGLRKTANMFVNPQFAKQLLEYAILSIADGSAAFKFPCSVPY